MKLSLLFIIILLSATKLFAGVVNSGGGKAVVCYNDKSKRQIKIVKSLDLVEGELLERHTHAESRLPFNTQVEEIIKKIPQGIPWREQLEIWSKEVMKGIKILPAGVFLKPVDDSYEVFLYDQNCEIQQLAHFLKIDSIMINGDFWAKMSETQKAALVLHESIYYLTRTAGETDSKRARRMVSFLMSEGAQIISPIASIPKESYMCYGESTNSSSGIKNITSLYVYKNDHGNYDFNFLVLNGKVKLSKYLLTLPLREFPLWVPDQLLQEGYAIDSNFEKEMTNLKIEFMPNEISTPIQFKISGSSQGYYGDFMAPVIVTCLPRFATQKINHYEFLVFKSIYIPAAGFACQLNREIFSYATAPVEFAYEIKENENLRLEHVDIYVKDAQGNYLEMDVKAEDIDCLNKGTRSLDPQKNFFKAFLNFAVDSKVYGESDQFHITTREALLVIRLTKKLADNSLDFIVYKVPFKFTRYNW